MAIKDINGGKVSTKQAKEIINDALNGMEQETFKGAVEKGREHEAETFAMPRSVEEAQAKEIELRNAGNARAAGQFSQGFLGTIAQKLIYQTITGAYISDEESFINRFRGQNIDYGTMKEYVFTQMGGIADMDPEQFIPASTTKSSVISQITSFLTQDGRLNTNARAFMKMIPLSIQTYATKEYMLSDVQLSKFVSSIRDGIVNSAKLFIHNQIMSMIKAGIASATTTPNGTGITLINGQATNMFDACIEICNHIRRSEKTGSKYQLIQSTNASENHVRAASARNYTWIWSINNDERANRGIKSQLYHYKLWDKGSSIDEANVYCPGTEISLPDITTNKQNNFPTDTGNYWIDDQTVVILENGAIEYNMVWEKTETQYYTNNMTLQITYHMAGMFNFIKPMRGFIYKNPNLNMVP